jgi:hypothetical protein
MEERRQVDAPTKGSGIESILRDTMQNPFLASIRVDPGRERKPNSKTAPNLKTSSGTTYPAAPA